MEKIMKQMKKELVKEIKEEIRADLLKEIRVDLLKEIKADIRKEETKAASSSGEKPLEDEPIEKKRKTMIYAATPKNGVIKTDSNRGSRSEPRDFPSKRCLSYIDAKIIEPYQKVEDSRLLRHIFDRNLLKSEILAHIDDCVCRRFNFDTLRPHQWVDDLVINTSIAMFEDEERGKHQPPRSWFLPTTVY